MVSSQSSGDAVSSEASSSSGPSSSALSTGALPSADAPPSAQADAAWRAVHQAACAPYRQAGRFAWHWARGKLGRDPVFRGMLQRGDLPAQARVVDIGCGQGLVASLLHACDQLQQQGRWPADWPVRAGARAYTGIELMTRDVQRGQAALARLHGAAFVPQLICADMRQAPLPCCDVVVILDVLHYVDHAAQAELLQRVRTALLPNLQPNQQPSSQPNVQNPAASSDAPTPRPGRLLLRVGDAASTRGFAVSQWVDRVVTGVRGHRVPPTWGRTLVQWQGLLQDLGFVVRSVPQSQGTPFANVLLIADLP